MSDTEYYFNVHVDVGEFDSGVYMVVATDENGAIKDVLDYLSTDNFKVVNVQNLGEVEQEDEE